ncbi:MAG: SurA N-terminal domain-containing protein [Patescibacteria group bacterium]|nr:SurA N-terminal domain-containing protein [Patescibacteria group bacterium]
MPRKKQMTKKNLSVSNQPIIEDNNRELDRGKTGFRFTSFLGILILILIFFVLGSIIYKNKKWFVAGIVNGKPITSVELYGRLVSQYGKQMLDQIAVERLLQQEAMKRKITVTASDIDNEVKKIEQSLGTTTTLNDALAQQGMTLKMLRDQVKLRLTAVKLVEDKVKVTAEDVDKYISENKDAITAGEDIAKQKESIMNFLKDQKVSEEIQKLIDGLKSKAKISNYL